MEIRLGHKDEWHSSHLQGGWEYWYASIRHDDEAEKLYIEDTNFVYRNRETGELRLPHRFNPFERDSYPIYFDTLRRGNLPLDGVELEKDGKCGSYRLDWERLKGMYPDFRAVIYRRPDGKQFDLPDPEERGSLSRYELRGKDVFDFLDVELRTEVDLDMLADTAPVAYAELSHASRTDAPQFRSIEFPDIYVHDDRDSFDSIPIYFGINPMEMSLAAKLESADTLTGNDAFHVAGLLAQTRAYNTKRREFKESLMRVGHSGKAMRDVSRAVYHCCTERGEFYSTAIQKGLKFLATAYDQDGIGRMLNSKDCLFRDDPPLMEEAREFLRSRIFSRYCDSMHEQRGYTAAR